MRDYARTLWKFFPLFILSALLSCTPTPYANDRLEFTVVADMRNYLGADEFTGAAEAIAETGAGEFVVSPGDIDPPDTVYAVLETYLGSDVAWYPGVGNHEAETASDMDWLRTFNADGTTLPDIVNPGPSGSVETCYSFNRQNAHFVMINEYYTGAVDDDPTGDVSPALLSWLQDDLEANDLPIVFVFGHEPAFPQPDMEPPNRLRHELDSLNQFPANRDAFWQTLVDHEVTAYICGHTHSYSRIRIDGVWQIDSAHSRGAADTGARSTFIHFSISDSDTVEFQAWRLNFTSGDYEITDWGVL